LSFVFLPNSPFDGFASLSLILNTFAVVFLIFSFTTSYSVFLDFFPFSFSSLANSSSLICNTPSLKNLYSVNLKYSFKLLFNFSILSSVSFFSFSDNSETSLEINSKYIFL